MEKKKGEPNCKQCGKSRAFSGSDACLSCGHPWPKKRKKWGDPGSRVKRVTQAMLRSGRKSRRVVVSIYPTGIAGYRLLGERREYYRNAAADYADAAARTQRAEREAKRKARKEKR
jgi:hypothetical protein